MDRTTLILAAVGAALAAAPALADDRRIVADLDTAFQAAVKRNDADAIDRILHPDFVLVAGSGQIQTRAEAIAEARSGAIHYEIQDEDPGTQTVRLYGDAAVVTARLWIKGSQDGKPFERRLWFSDLYVRTRDGWRYAFGQVGAHLPLR